MVLHRQLHHQSHHQSLMGLHRQSQSPVWSSDESKQGCAPHLSLEGDSSWRMCIVAAVEMRFAIAMYKLSAA